VTVSLLDNTASRGDAEGDVFSGFENILGSDFNDVLTGDAGANVISGWDGNDLILGEDGDDELDGGDGDDDLRGGAGADTLVGGAGNDRLRSGEGSGDVLIGGEGDDTYYIDSLGAQVIEVGGQGFDRVYSTVTFNGAGQDIERMAIIGEANANILGNDLDNTLIGNDASNGLNGGAGADLMQGRGGNDVYTVDNVGDVVVEVEGGGVDLVRSSVSFDAGSTHVENITLTGSTLIDAVGNDLNNIIIGNNAANLINGGGGADRMEGLGGDDTYVVDSRDDLVVEIDGGGIDTVLSSVSFDGRFTHVENITLTGEANANVVGNDLNNIIIGNSAANVLKGMGGDDTYHVDSRDDVVIEAEGGGVDTVVSTVSFDARSAHVENITLAGDVNANVVGNDLDNVIIGNEAANVIKGGGGADLMEGLGGGDTYVVDSRDDVVVEVADGGVDTVLSSVSFDARTTHVENITLLDGANANIIANDLGNTLRGNSAANIIIGGGGADLMTGGGGADTFRYNAVSDSTFSDYDRIMDLGADDFIDLRNIDSNVNTEGNQSFTQVDELTGEAGQMTLEWLPSAGFTLMSMDVDGDGVADMRVVLYGDHSDFDNFLGVGG